MSYMVIDTETNGLFDFKRPADAEGQARLASLAIIKLDDALNEEARVQYFIKPEGWEMAPGATAVNGLTTEFLLENGESIRDVLEVYSKLVLEGRAVIAHNAQFDCKMMRGELRRAGMDDLFEQTPNFCTMRGSMAIGIKKAVGRGWPKLDDICAHYGIERGEKHTSLADASDTAECVRSMVAAGYEIRPTVHHAKDYDAIRNAK